MSPLIKRYFASSTALSVADLRAARSRIAERIPVSPLTHSNRLSESFGAEIYIKWDSQLPTGSFKERGALNFLLQLSEAERKRGVCAASAGNHALGLSTHAKALDIACQIVMPEGASLVKVEANRKAGATVTQIGKTFAESYEAAQEICRSKGFVFVPAFDDPKIIAGQGVAGLEILDQLSEVDTVIVPIGGGGYVSGIAIAIKEIKPSTKLIGVVSDWALAARDGQHPMYNGLQTSSIADGISIKKLGAITQPILEKALDLLVSVSERSIAKAVVMFLEKERAVVEGSGAAPLAALIDGLELGVAKKVLLMCSGSNIDTAVLSNLISWDMGERGRTLRLRMSLPDRPGVLEWLSGLLAKSGANIAQIFHDRSYAKVPGCVEISCIIEVRNREHGEEVTELLAKAGVKSD